MTLRSWPCGAMNKKILLKFEYLLHICNADLAYFHHPTPLLICCLPLIRQLKNNTRLFDGLQSAECLH